MSYSAYTKVEHETAPAPARAPSPAPALNGVPSVIEEPRPDQPLPLEIRNVVKGWGRKNPPVLKGIDLEIEPGQLVWVGGRNGVGKTTLLRVVSGLIGATDGEVRAFGLDPKRDRRAYQRRVAFLSAGNTGVYARLTVRQQLDVWARIAFVPRAERAAAVDSALEQFMLEDLAGNRSDRLSMGQRQRLRIAMTFIGGPDLLLLDEPRTSLDGEGGAILTNAIRETIMRGGAVLWVSPTGEPIGMRFDQRHVIEDGKLRAA
ncbi:MAG TPA: ABC transporter ATP-binding protein [Thermoleophilaceae bacterium]|nr:ABC transporter ATP-binding protein [Thermoleophilaceae bacterium]